MKKALYVATVDIHIKKFHLPYLKLLHENGYEVHVATNGEEQFPYCDVKHKICIERSPFNIRNIKAINQLKKIIDSEKFDIVHCHTPMGGVVARLAAKKARKKFGTRVIYTAHGFHFYKGAPKLNWILFYPIEKKLSKYTDTLITINEEDYKLAKKKFEKRCHNIEYVPGVGIELDKFKIKMSTNEVKEYKKNLGLKDSDFILSCVARLDKNKNQYFLIKVMEQLVLDNKKIHLLLIGNDELHGYYHRIVEKKHLEKYVHFLGNRNDIPQLLAISDIVVSASKREGMPINIIEALASQKPIVSLECRGMKELLWDKPNCYVIKNNNQNEFVRKIERLLNRDKEKDDITIPKIEKYSIDSIKNKFLYIYNLNTKIPHIIHFVWMGKQDKGKNIEKCMKTWKKLRGFRIIEWNEDNFNIEEHPFCKKAYDNKKWAFVSDYVRAWAVYKYGGIYFDTDILLIDSNSFYKLLDNEAFVGFENKNAPFTAVFGAVKGHPLTEKMLNHYNDENNDFTTTNTQWISQLLIDKYNCKLGNKEQDLNDNIHVYPKEVLCEPSKKSITIHAFTGSWLKKKSFFSKISTFLRVNANYKICRFIYRILIVPIKEKKNERVYNDNNANI